ncbi:oxaloacetate decarboxylase [Burkholderia sp. L27(2015)]|uniref:isocitrate lyase/PEP mutase family protein n=1 Tax=Burkholderia sp. L27(2015) TaxID=1641858 RepID=UPI00131B850C|nr:isocitrate lyase/PEP mutase family protein [Burkholderia sp. L27(2015)]
MKYMNLRAQLRKRLAENRTLVAPGVYDALSAMQVELAGFETVHAGSYSFASSLGLPDVGILNMTELCNKVREISEAVSIPVIADAENGFHGPAAIARVVRAFEQAGACGIHIEDHLSGKHTSEPKRVVPLEQAVQKIRAAVAGREDPNFLVIARTDIASVTNRVADVAERMLAFAQAGADAVMPIGLTLEQLGEIRQRIPAPVVIVNTNGDSLESERAAGADIVIYHSFCVDAATFGIKRALQRFTETKNIRSLEGSVSSHLEMEVLLNYAEYDRRRQCHATDIALPTLMS